MKFLWFYQTKSYETIIVYYNAEYIFKKIHEKSEVSDFESCNYVNKYNNMHESVLRIKITGILYGKTTFLKLSLILYSA